MMIPQFESTCDVTCPIRVQGCDQYFTKLGNFEAISDLLAAEYA